MGLDIGFFANGEKTDNTTAVEQLINRRREEDNRTLKAVGFSVLGIPLGAVDTIGQSLGIFEDGTVEKGLRAVSRLASETYADNKGGYRVLGDIGATFVGAGVAAKALRTGSAGIRLLSNSGKYGKLTANLIKTNPQRVDSLVAQYGKRAEVFGSKTGLTNYRVDATGSALRRNARIAQFKDSIKEGLAGEAFVLAFQNKSDLYFPDNMSATDYGVMSVAGMGLGAGIGQLILNPALKNAAARAGSAADKRGKVTGNYGTDVVASVTNAQSYDNVALYGDITKGDTTLIGQIQKAKVHSLDVAKRGIEALGNKSPLTGVTGRHSIDVAQAEELIEQVGHHPAIFNNAVSIDEPGLFSRFPEARDASLKALEEGLPKLQNKLSKLEQGSAEYLTTLDNISATKESIRKFKDNTYEAYRVNALGQIKALDDSQPIIADGVYKVKQRTPITAGSLDELPIFAVKDTGVDVSGIPFIGQADTALTTQPIDVMKSSQIYASMPEALKAAELMHSGAAFKLTPPRAFSLSKASHYELDYLIELTKRLGDGENPSLSSIGEIVSFANAGKNVNLSSLDDLKFASLNKKFKLFNSKLRKKNQASMDDLSNMLNLRLTGDMTDGSALTEFFSDLISDGVNDLNKVAKDYKELLSHFKKHSLADATEGTIAEAYKGSQDVYLMEKFINGNLPAKYEKPIKPVTIVVENPSTGFGDENWIREHNTVAKVALEQREKLIERTIAESKNPLLTTLDDTFRELTPLVESVKQSAPRLTNGVTNDPVFKQLGSIGVGTKDFNLRGVQGADAASTIGDTIQRRTLKMLTTDMVDNTKNVAKIRQHGNDKSLNLYGLYQTAMQRGWELAEDTIDSSGLFKLAKTDTNKQIAKQIGLDDVPQYLPNPLDAKQALQLDKLAQEALKEIKRYDRIIHQANRLFARVNGHQMPSFVKGHSIIPGRYGQEMAFITDELGRVVDYSMGRDIAAARAAAKKKAGTRKHAERYGVVDRSSPALYYQLRERAWNSGYLDVADSFGKTGAVGVKGTRQGIVDGGTYITAQLDELRKSYTNIGSRFIELKMAPTIEELRFIQKVADVDKEGFGAGGKAFDDVFDNFYQTLTNQKGANPGSLYGRINAVIEQGADSGLNKLIEMGKALKGDLASSSAAAKVAAIRERFGFDPNGRAIAYATQELDKQEIPTRALDIMRKSSAATTAVVLKFMEVSHGLLTVVSLGSTVPHTAAWFKPLKNESIEAFSKRIGWASDLLHDGEQIVVPNSTKVMLETTHRMFDGSMTKAFEAAKNRGYLEAPLAELFTIMGHPKEKWYSRYSDKFFEVMGAPSMKAEEFARAYSFAAGYQLAKQAGRASEEMALAFGNNFANRAIADYRTNQKAQLFDGFVGTPLSLFQTFAINYYQKLLGDVENKAVKAMLTRYGTQGFIFGAESVPGYDFANEVMFRNYDGTASPYDLMKQGTVPGFGDLLLHGTVSNLPKLLGFDDGISLYTRGEMQLPRNVSLFSIAQAPVVALASRSAKVLSEGFDALLQEGSLGVDALREAAILAMPNRPLKGILEVAQGYSTNSRGELIDADTRGLLDIISRVAGLKPMREAEQAKIAWLNTQTRQAQRARLANLHRAVVSVIRTDGGKIDTDRLNEVFIDYQRYGGNPENFKRWLKGLVMKATTPGYERKIVKAIKRDPNSQESIRFLSGAETSYFTNEKD